MLHEQQVFNQYGDGLNYQASKMDIRNIYGGDHVVVSQVSSAELRMGDNDHFVEPQEEHRKNWAAAQQALRIHGVVVLVGLRGTGRHTAAVRLLRTVVAGDLADKVYDLEAEWDTPRIDCLKDAPVPRGILDMSEPTSESAEPSFGQKLAELGQNAVHEGRYLVVLSTPEVWQGNWTRGSEPFTFPYFSPDAKELVRRELASRGLGSRLGILDDKRFDEVWTSNPKAEDAVRLAELIARSPEGEYDDVLDEYSEWRDYIRGLLRADTSGTAATLAKRATLWAAALLDGGSTRSVIAASDALLDKVGMSRRPSEVLGGPLVSERLRDVEVLLENDRVRLGSSRHGLRQAVLNRMWDEFSTQHAVLSSWAVSVAADPRVSDVEARFVVDVITEASIRRRDGHILTLLREELLEKRRTLVAEALTSAALDETFGVHVRKTLYQWAKTPSSGVADLVAEVCGGEFGRRMPEMALVRLGHVAKQGWFESQAIVRAFETLASHAPANVLTALDKWWSDEGWHVAGKVALLALASTPVGRALLVGEDGGQLLDPEHRRWVVGMWQVVVMDGAAGPHVERCLRDWGEAVGGNRDLEDLFTEVFTPPEHRAVATSLVDFTPEIENTFWGRVFLRSVAASRMRYSDAGE